MTIIKAEKTLELIESEVKKDSGAKFRKFLGLVLPHISDAYRTDEEGFRTHLGASIIGRKCSREIWYGFRWSFKDDFSGRMYRLFNRGHLEEGRFIALLLAIGCQVMQQDENGTQFRLKALGGHFGGSGDGFVIGIPELPNEMVLTEFKTHNDASFKKLIGEGVQKAKPEHYIQMQIYMAAFNVNHALYMAVNKNNDEIWAEIIIRDNEVSDKYLMKASEIVFNETPPPKISNSPGWFECRFCTFKTICHGNDKPEFNCRTCGYSNANQDGNWKCSLLEKNLTKEEQIKGCNQYKRKF